MSEIDIEEIRKAALSEATQNLPENAYGEMLRLYAELSSQVTELMLERYHKQLREAD